VSVSVRPWAMSAAVMAGAGVLALGPASTVPSAPVSVPVVHVEDITLAGVGQDIYNAVTPAVQYVVGGGSYLINVIPIIGAPIAAQVNINYFQLIQPVVAATVNYLAGVVQDPVNVIPTTQAYGVTLYDIGYNYVSAQLRFLGLQPPAPLPPIAASVRAPRATAAAARSSAKPGDSEAATAGPVRALAGASRGQSRSTPGAARSVARAAAATAAKRFG